MRKRASESRKRNEVMDHRDVRAWRKERTRREEDDGRPRKRMEEICSPFWEKM